MKARWTVSSTLESKLDSLADLSSETTNAPQEPDLGGIGISGCLPKDVYVLLTEFLRDRLSREQFLKYTYVCTLVIP